ncbi:MAG: alpha/beta fold hydrolase [Candidatus Cloacimonadales bacterium]
MRKILYLAIIFLFLSNLYAENVEEKLQTECVVLIHGLGDVKLSMLKLKNEIEAAGFATYNIGYPFGKKVEEVATDEFAAAIAACQEYDKIHLVTHSMGGLIARYYLSDNRLPAGSRIVMLSPPNQGSQVADYFADSRLYNLFYGAAGQDVSTDSKLLDKLKPLKYEVGIIAGDRSFNPFFSDLLPGADDGKVAVQSTKLAEMTDFMTISATHLMIKYHPEVARQTIHFLKNGKFAPEQ